MSNVKMPKGINSLSAVCAALACAVSVCACAPDSNGEQAELILDNFTDEVSLHTELQSSYLSGPYDGIKAYAVGNAELSRPDAVDFLWWCEPSAESYTLELSEDADFARPIVYKTDMSYLDVYNLKVGTEYYWRVTAEFSSGKKCTSEPSVFITADDAPRNLYVDGVKNARDLGGWKTSSGKTVKQGMMIRCGRLNKSETTEVKIEITEQGIATMRDVLGVRTEIDLRMPNAHNTETGGITESPLGSDINYVNISMDWASNSSSFNYLSEEEYYSAIKDFFAVAADINNYPIIFHCNIGTDRTGLFAFLINGLVGVGEEDLYRDYLFSNFADIGGARAVSNIKAYVDKVKSYAGASLSEQIANCLVEGVGVPRADIDKVIEIMTNDI